MRECWEATAQAVADPLAPSMRLRAYALYMCNVLEILELVVHAAPHVFAQLPTYLEGEEVLCQILSPI